MTDFPIEIVRSQRRTKTAQARLSDGRIRVMVPANLPPEEEQRVVAELSSRIVRKQTSTQIDLESRARQLAAKYSLPTPQSISWSNRQNTRWGSCTPAAGRIRISTRLTSMPAWVLDSVIVHELAHLKETGHGIRFHELTSRYELTERARGYLMAKEEEQVKAEGPPGRAGPQR
jgi:predicted metal-dependent hydrolase